MWDLQLQKSGAVLQKQNTVSTTRDGDVEMVTIKKRHTSFSSSIPLAPNRGRCSVSFQAQASASVLFDLEAV